MDAVSPDSPPTTARDHTRKRVEVRYIRHGEVRARVSTIGADGDRAFVLVAGIGVASNYYENLAPGLGEFGPVHALDLPGFAGVPYPKRRMSIQRYAAVLGTVIDELGLVDPVLVGHSMGTQVVSELASQRPELSTLVLIGPVTNPRERSLPKLAFRFLESSAHEPFRVAMLATGAYLLCGFRWFSAVLPRMMRYRIEEVLPSIQAHTLLIRGEHDSLVPRSWLREMAELLPRASTWEIEGAAHSVMYDHAKDVAELCVDHAREPFDTRSADDGGEGGVVGVVGDATERSSAVGSSAGGSGAVGSGTVRAPWRRGPSTPTTSPTPRPASSCRSPTRMRVIAESASALASCCRCCARGGTSSSRAPTTARKTSPKRRPSTSGRRWRPSRRRSRTNPQRRDLPAETRPCAD